jgi:hypothetical protein
MRTVEVVDSCKAIGGARRIGRRVLHWRPSCSGGSAWSAEALVKALGNGRVLTWTEGV